MTRTLVASLVAAVLLMAAPRRSEACSCKQPPAPKPALANSAAVFEGKVVKLGRDTAKDRLTATFAVTRWWKGGEAAHVEVSTIGIDSMCGVGFVEGEEWLVYAGGDAAGLSASLCSRTKRKADAEADRKALGAGKAPVSGSAPGDPLATEPTKVEEPPATVEEPPPTEPAKVEAPTRAEAKPTATPPPAAEGKPATAGCAIAGEPAGLGLVVLGLLARRRRRA